MYNSNYEQYMRNVLGYVPNNTYQMNDSMYEYNQARGYDEATIEGFFPEIYRTVYPFVKNACMRISGNINRDIIEQITDEVYRAVEENDSNRKVTETRNTQQPKRMEETRQRNYLLRDLIKILILRELIGRPGPSRPPMSPPRPPMRPPMPPPSPPRPRTRLEDSY